MEQPPPLEQTVAARILELLEARDLTQRDLAAGAGIPIATLSRRLTGKSPVTITELAHIASYFGVDPRSLIQAEAAA